MLKLDINLLWTVVNVLIMYALLRKFLFKPVQDVLDKRQKMVDDELANAQDAKTKAEAALAACRIQNGRCKTGGISDEVPQPRR